MSRAPRRVLTALTLSISLLLAPAMAQPQPAADAATTASAQHTPPTPLLWKVSQGEQAMYLLGSFHLLLPTDYPLSADVIAVQGQADKLVMEMSPQEMASPALPMMMAQAAARTDGSMLDSDLPAQTRADLQQWVNANAQLLQQSQIPPQALQVMQPWYVGLLVTMLEFGKYGLQPELGLDKHMGDAASARGIPTAGLETAEQQVSFLAGMDLPVQVAFLQEALKSAEQGPEEISKLHHMWRTGDLDGLWNEMAVPMREQFPDLYARINVQRNDAWVPKLEALLHDDQYQNVLVVVGALHLLGEDGVVEKLAARGYQVERICSSCQ